MASPPPPSPSPPFPSAVDHLRTLLQKLLRIHTTDGRVFIGTFAGTDKPLNIILVNAEEYRMKGSSAADDADTDGRYVGQVMLPWKVVLKVEAHLPGDKMGESLYL